MLQTLKEKQDLAPSTPSLLDSVEPTSGYSKAEANTSSLSSQPSLVEDFIRNFLIRHEMKETLESFQHEWYQSNYGNSNIQKEYVPDVFQQKEKLEDKIIQLQKDLEKMEKITNNAKNTWERLRKDRDYHRMHHRRVVVEKNELHKKLKRITKHAEQYEPIFKEMKVKYEKALKEKTLAKMDRDKIKLELDTLNSNQQFKPIENSNTKFLNSKKNANKLKKSTGTGAKKNDSLLPVEDRTNPHTQQEYETVEIEKWIKDKNFKCHSLPISRLTFHPSKDIIASVSDDCSWKMWDIPSGNLIMSGEGHLEWISDCHFHPSGSLLATSSGDGTVKLWDFLESRCTATFTDHTQAVWGCEFHDSGDFLASCSMDHTARLWDIQSERCRQTFRGHVDSVNYVTFQPFSNNMVTASGDKTLSLWDLRSGLCSQTFYGHNNAINHATFDLKGQYILSSDSDGVVKKWDCRMISEMCSIKASQRPISESLFDPSCQRIIVGTEENSIKIYDESGASLGEHNEHTDSVNSMVFSNDFKYLISGSSDTECIIWLNSTNATEKSNSKKEKRNLASNNEDAEDEEES